MPIPIPEIKEQLLNFLEEQDLYNSKDHSLLSFAYKINSFDLLPLTDPVIKEQNKVFYFNRPEEDFELLAFNELIAVNVNGNNRFTNLRTKISDITAFTLDNFEKDQNFPLLFGGTKFCSINNSDEWKDFDDNDWFVPKFLFYNKNGQAYCIINFIIQNFTTDEQYFNDIFEQLDQINKIIYYTELYEQTASIKINRLEDESGKWNLLVNNALDKIKAGLFRKVVLSRQLIADITGSVSFDAILNHLCKEYRNCNIFLYKSNDSVLFGATPEQLLKFKDKEIEFDALAGSAKRGSTVEEDNQIANNLLIDKKNGNEHNHVIEFIKDVSLRYVQDFRQAATGIKKFSNIQHIYTPIKGDLKSREQIFNLVEDIFPTPAICGSPKNAAIKYITENENFDRGMFCGIVGFISSDEMDLSVAIRSALLTQNKLFIYAGCGIVDGSNPQSEFEETEIKMRPILSLFKHEN